jgi:hypothetical protein
MFYLRGQKWDAVLGHPILALSAAQRHLHHWRSFDMNSIFQDGGCVVVGKTFSSPSTAAHV